MPFVGFFSLALHVLLKTVISLAAAHLDIENKVTKY